jgi:L-alanine-DL-glutamate epimerase-like enolase superfamily enzyme
MARALRVRGERWPLRRAFTISRGTKTVAEVVVAEIEEDGVVGRGECVPYPRYGETVAEVVRRIESQAAAIAAGLSRERLQSALSAGAARNALDCALWDLEAKRSVRRAWEIAGIDPPGPAITAETIGLDTPRAMAEAAAQLKGQPLLKIKLGAEAVVERVAAVRDAAPQARLIVDANEAWDLVLLERVCAALAGLGVEMIEQPLAAGDDAGLRGFSSPVPLCADESCHTAAEVADLADRYRMVNVKLDKTGGLTEALRLVAAAGDAGLDVMVGCMVGTSLAMAPATLLTGCAAYVDLDGPLLLARDRAPSLRFAGGAVFPPEPALWG